MDEVQDDLNDSDKWMLSNAFKKLGSCMWQVHRLYAAVYFKAVNALSEFNNINIILPSGVTRYILHSGLMAFIAVAIPEDNPPPLIVTITASKSGTCSNNSRPIVPW